jgi:hypothetical protein
MGQGPIAVADANLIPQGAKSVKNITTATVLKATPGTVLGFAVIVAGSAAGTINDVATTGGAAVGNQVGVTPATQGNYPLYGVPCTTGIVIVPGTGQTIAAWYV